MNARAHLIAAIALIMGCTDGPLGEVGTYEPNVGGGDPSDGGDAFDGGAAGSSATTCDASCVDGTTPVSSSDAGSAEAGASPLPREVCRTATWVEDGTLEAGHYINGSLVMDPTGNMIVVSGYLSTALGGATLKASGTRDSGYGFLSECGNGSHKNNADQQSCLAMSFGDQCNSTVSQFEACIIAQVPSLQCAPQPACSHVYC